MMRTAEDLNVISCLAKCMARMLVKEHLGESAITLGSFLELYSSGKRHHMPLIWSVSLMSSWCGSVSVVISGFLRLPAPCTFFRIFIGRSPDCGCSLIFNRIC